jgi:hypothetical protein
LYILIISLIIFKEFKDQYMINRKTVFYAFIFFFSFLISCFGEPRIEFSETNFNFGKVSQNSELKHIFIFKNKGNSTLTIEKIKTG